METLIHGIKRSIPALFLFFGAMLFAGKGIGQGSQTFSTPGSFTFTVPAGVTSITISTWGGGGAGGGVTDEPRGGGGGEGGSFVRGTIPVTPGLSYTVVVGSGGVGSTGSGTNGGSSSFGSGLFLAIGGAGGAVGNNLGAGGNTANTGNIESGTATVSNYGGIGATATTASTASSGGGGGSAGAGGAGGDGGVPTNPISAGAAGAAGSPSAPGALGGAGRGATSDGNGNSGAVPGGGGGGARNANNGTDYTGGAGGNGQVLVTWICPAATISYPPSICKSSSSLNVTVNGAPGGTFSSTAGLSLNTSTGEINPSTSNAGSYSVQYQIAGGSGCSAVNTSANIQINASPVSSVVGQSDVTCFAGSDGSINIGATGGTTGPYFYSVDNGATWTPSAHASPYAFGGLSANIQYRIRVKDGNGCESK